MLRVVPGPAEQRRREVDAIGEVSFAVRVEKGVPTTWIVTDVINWKVNLVLMSDLLWHIREVPNLIGPWFREVCPELTIEVSVLRL